MLCLSIFDMSDESFPVIKKLSGEAHKFVNILQILDNYNIAILEKKVNNKLPGTE